MAKISPARKALRAANKKIKAGTATKKDREKARTATIAVKAEGRAAEVRGTKGKKGTKLSNLRAEHAELMERRAKAKGKEKFDISLEARAYGDAMRAITGRQKGQGTAYTGPGVRVRIDDKGKVVSDETGAVQYDIDPNAYARRFIPQFKPTQQQLDYFKDIFGEKYNVSPGMATPWQQVNLQHMLQYPGLLGKDSIADLTIQEQKNLGIFGKDIKEGRVPAAWREAWRTEQWGDVKDPTTGLWTPATGAKRQQAVADQLERYKMGAFNPTTGKLTLDAQGNVTGPKAVWGPDRPGILHPDDVRIKNLPAAGTPAAVGAGIQLGGYRRPAPLDWSAIMPTDTPLASQQALVAGKGKLYQPWATRQATPRGLINYQVPGGAGFDVTYSGANPSLFDFNQQQNNQNNVVTNPLATNPAEWSFTYPSGQTTTNFGDYQRAAHNALYPGRFGTFGLDAEGNPLPAAPALGDAAALAALHGKG